ncbi:Lipase 3 [Orchesella cincta]|uniref:Lipase 3 n=1 Tax=Orchesella cincta TaxID=48709 RepID=A0A1D2M629_ORCCI|nr:Lipase 3 [Orchesella cincta]
MDCRAIFLLTIIIQSAAEAVAGSSSRGQRCPPYRPKRNIVRYLSDGECSREVGKVIGIPSPNLPSTTEEIQQRGYNVSTHSIISEDGYIQAIYRIAGGFKSPPKRGKRAVLLFHGGMGGSASWIIQPESRNLAFILVDAGYEVWLANGRGTAPSKNHTRLNADIDMEYWDFSFDEIALLDLPLLVDLMLWTTGTDQIYYACHSMGCSVYGAAVASLPDINRKIKAGFLLGPGIHIGSSTHPMFEILSGIVGTPLEKVMTKLLRGRVSAEPNALQRVLGLTPDGICTWSAIRCGVCDSYIFAFYGADPQQLNFTDLPNIIRKLQDNLAIKVLIHEIQNIEVCKFQRYDYGSKRNLVEYGSAAVPEYDLSKMTVPTYIFYGESDNLVTPADAERLRNAIPPEYVRGFYQVDWPLFNHIDFLMANDADILVYNRILQHIDDMEWEYKKGQDDYNQDKWYCLLLMFFTILVQNSTQLSSRNSNVRAQRCPPYIPRRNIANYLGNGECQREVGKVFGIPNPNPPSTTEEIQQRGYNVSTHSVISEDGYIQAIYRISGGFKSPPKRGKRGVLLFHGGMGGSASWIIQPESRNLAFILVDAGYEVWLANGRGTAPSKNHTRFNADTDLEYWDFSFDEIATKDLPLLVDLMLWTTETDQVYYVCHSMGCSVFGAAVALVPELNRKIKAGFLLGPGIHIGSSTHPLFETLTGIVGTPLEKVIIKLLRGRVSAETTALQRMLGLTTDGICTWSAIRCGICDNFIFAFYGADPQQLNFTDLPNIIRKLQDNLGIKVLIHGIQNIEVCKFQRFDYGPKRNLIEYGSVDPQQYDLSRMSVPTYIFYGESDNLVTPADAERLRNSIPPEFMRGFYQVDWPLFNHIDFLMANDADILVYNRILDNINEMEWENINVHDEYNLLHPQMYEGK